MPRSIEELKADMRKNMAEIKEFRETEKKAQLKALVDIIVQAVKMIVEVIRKQ